MKSILFALFLFTYSLSYCQGFSKNDSIIYLEEVMVTAKIHTDHIKIIKTKGKQNTSFSMRNKGIIISLVENIPLGKVKSLIFFFNNDKNRLYKDAEFRLVIFSVDKNNMPGKEVFDVDYRFIIKNNDKGKILLDLRKLNLKNYDKLFFGLELLKNSDGHDFFIDCNSVKNNNTFIKIEGMENWLKKQGSDLKTEIKIQTN